MSTLDFQDLGLVDDDEEAAEQTTFSIYAQLYKKLYMESKNVEKELEKCKNQLLELVGYQDHQESGLKIQKTERKGFIDYASFFKKHAEFEGEIEQYRRSPVVSWKVTPTFGG